MLLASLQSDDFNALSLGPQWTFTDPVGDASAVLDGTSALITVPAATNHNATGGGANKTARITQEVDDTDFEIEVKFDNVPEGRSANQGILVEQDAGDSLFFELRSDPRRSIRTLTISGGSLSSTNNGFLVAEGPFYMRVGRSSDSWTQSYSLDGQSWTVASVFNFALTVDRVGVYAGNSGSETAPEFVSAIDYVFDTASPISPEDATPSLDTTAPLNSRIEYQSPATTLSVEWNTNDSAIGSVDYGLTDQYELGTVTEASAGVGHTIQIDSLLEFSEYFFRIRSANELNGLTSSESNFLIRTGGNVDSQSKPVIDVWYGDSQQFGQIGNPQRWVNLLGNVFDPDGVQSVTYELNGDGNLQSLGLGPNATRLAKPGDFNIELDRASLSQGANTVQIVATDSQSNESLVTVSFSYDGSQIWPASFVADWSTAAVISDSAQLVDGLWTLGPNGVRTVEPGYERLISLGDMLAADYEVTVPITVHRWKQETASGVPAVGLIANWQGHSDADGSQPHTTQWPLGAIAWFKYGGLGLVGNEVADLTATTTLGRELELDQTYVFRLRVESNPGGPSTYYFKVWKESEPTPTEWDLVGEGLADELSSGSVVLLARYADATFGDVTICTAGSCQIGPVGDDDPAVDQVAENSPSGTAVGITAIAIDSDAGESVTYGLDDDAGGRFGIDHDSGQVTTLAQLDFEAAPSHSITVRATSTDGSQSTATFVIAVTNVSDTFPEKFVVVDFNAEQAFDYDDEFALLGSHSTHADNHRSRGIATDAAFLNYWVLNVNDEVFVYDAAFNLQGSWQATGLSDAQGIATDGEDIWITDVATDRVYFFDNVAGLTSGSVSPTSSFELTTANSHPYGITTDGNSLWVLNAGSGQQVFKYSVDGTYLGLWTIDNNLNGRGIAVDPGSPDHIWVADGNGNKVFQFNNAATLTGGRRLADQVFELAAANGDPQGIAAFRSITGPLFPITDADPADDEVFENSIVGTEVGITVSARDPDSTDTVSYELVDDAGGRFAIDPLSGVVATAAVLDFEAGGSHSITARATSSDGSTSVADFTVTVISENVLEGFLLADQVSSTIYQYDADFVLNGTFDLASGPRGVATDIGGGTVWTVNAAGGVDLHDADRNPLGSWTAIDVTEPEGIASDEQHVWILDSGANGADRIRYYQNAAGVTHGELSSTSSFQLADGNNEAWGVTTDGVHLWTINTYPAIEVYKYTVAGELVGNWTVDGADGTARGIAVAAGSVDDVWIVLRGGDKVLRYDGAANRTEGSQGPAASFDLAAGNSTPQGLAKFGVTLSQGPQVSFNELTSADASPPLSGSIDDPLATVVVTVAGIQYTAINHADGTWTLGNDSIDPPLAEGSHQVVVVGTDGDGHTNSVDGQLTIDLTPPTVTVNPLTTGDVTPTLTGTIDAAEAVVVVEVNGNSYAANHADGIWTVSAISPPLDSGTYDVTATATDGAGNTASDGTVDELVIDFSIPQVDLLVVDQGVDDAFWYDLTGTLSDSHELGSGNNAPRGAALDPVSGRTWVVDNDDHVYVYDSTATLIGAWKALGLGAPNGIATDGEDIWIADSGRDRVYWFAGAANLTSGSSSAALDFKLAASNRNPRGLTTDGTHLWIVNDAGANKVFKYDLSGSLLGNWTLDSDNSRPRGIAVNPSDVDSIWVLDAQLDRVFQYDGGAGLTTGSHSASSFFSLDSANTAPEGLALHIGVPAADGPSVTVDPLLTQDPTPELTGTTDDPTAAVTVHVQGNEYAAANQGDGTWSLVDNSILPALADGTYDVTATVTDQEGNSSSDSTADELVVDTTPPVVAIDELATSDHSPPLTGTVNESGAVVTITINGDSYPAINDGAGVWTLPGGTIDPPLSEGVYDVTVVALDPVGNVGQDSSVDELVVNPAGAAKFVVVDQSADDAFQYDAAGNSLANYELGTGNNVPRGAAADATGDRLWVVDNDDFVYVYDGAGILLGSWKALGLAAPNGIGSDGVNIWIVDSGKDRLFFFEGAANLTSGSIASSSNFKLASSNRNPRGLTTDGTNLWVVNDAGSDKVFRYDLAGSLIGVWTIDSANTKPRGITIDPTEIDTVWILDAAKDRVYQYDGGADYTSGSKTADGSFPLHAQNGAGEGIADPPTSSLQNGEWDASLLSDPAVQPPSNGELPIYGGFDGLISQASRGFQSPVAARKVHRSTGESGTAAPADAPNHVSRDVSARSSGAGEPQRRDDNWSADLLSTDLPEELLQLLAEHFSLEGGRGLGEN